MEGIDERSALGNRILHLAQSHNISDFYITPWEQLIYRKNGEMNFDSFVFQPETAMEVKPGTIDYAWQLGPLRFRVNQLVTRGRLRWVMRLLPDQIPTPEQISLPAQALKSYLEAENGLFLICGATGSGKSTTIASMIAARAERRREHVITFEDPIEYILPTNLPTLVTQREMGSDDTNFGTSLRAALRQAPDVIMIGEIRDGETADIALQAAETGHVVIATMHTSSAAQTVQRFLKLVPSDRMENAMLSFADSMRMILCQQLLYDNTKERRFGIHEILFPYDSVTGMIRRGDFKRLDHELETGTTKGMQSFEYSIAMRAYEGWKSGARKATGFSEHEVAEYLHHERTLESDNQNLQQQPSTSA
ncbi:type IV pilus twitching motility protein PilT [Verrucomicrobiales bacterium]|nr:type IV pilus twitching motility protein PilT [Verrucomicrobiales bacterium]